MKDLIERQAAIDYCYQLINVEHEQGSDEMNYGRERVNQTETILHHLEFMPSEQPEIIQCKDCKYWREGVAYSYCDKLFNMGVLDVYDYMVSDDDFCSKAERREDERRKV